MECNLRDKVHPVVKASSNRRRSAALSRWINCNTLLKYLICMLVLLMAVSCSPQVKIAKKAPLQRYNTILCESVDQFDHIGIPLNPTENFNIKDKQIVAFVRFDNLSGNYNLRWNWYTPQGKLHRRSENIPVAISKGKFCRTVTAWHALDVKNDLVFLFPGQWTVEFKVNDEIIDRKKFSFQKRSSL